MIRRTRWSPDTCGCIIEFEWDDTVSADARVHTPAALVQQCALHAGQSLQETYDDLVDENPRKNRLEARLLSAFPAQLGWTNPQTGELELVRGAYAYSITGRRGQRVLTIALPLLTNAQRVAAQTWADNNIGAGRVVVTG